MTRLEKSRGTTPTEKYLAQLCERAFLRFWSYPNLYRDRGEGKEICDVLVVFGRDIVIFSDKSCAYPDSGDEVKDWTRWFRRSVWKSAQQIFGAERWIRQHPERIFLDPKCTQALPIELPDSSDMHIHRVVVARGAGERCSAFFGGDTGSLRIRNDLIGDAHVNPEAGPLEFFCVGQLEPEKGYVHIFDDGNLYILLSELDTATDFIEYLRRKEALICSEKVVSATGEEDLLAHFLTHVDGNKEHNFVIPPGVDIVWFDHLYEGMPENGQYIAKKKADQVSYIIDELIENVASSAAQGTLVSGNKLSILMQEKALRILAAENRLSRRHLGTALVNLLCSAATDGRPKVKCVTTSSQSGTGYCFLVMPYQGGTDYNRYKEYRSALLFDYLRVMKVKFPRLQTSLVSTYPTGQRRRTAG